MARNGKADREHSGHYLTAVAVVTVVVASMAWFGQNRLLAAAAAALGLYALHLLSIRFLLDNQRRQREVLDAQWEVLQQFLGGAEAEGVDPDELVPAMPIDRENPEKPATPDRDEVDEIVGIPDETLDIVVEAVESPADQQLVAESAKWDAGDQAEPVQPVATTEVVVETAAWPTNEDAVDVEPVVLGELVPPLEAQAEFESEQPPTTDSDGDFEPDSPGLVGIPAPSGVHKPHGAATEVPVPRHFALGTVALVRDLLTPAEVARVLLEQRRQPGKKFGELAVALGMLSESQREELLLAQQEGLFTDAEMREARRRLREFRENAAHSMAGLD